MKKHIYMGLSTFVILFVFYYTTSFIKTDKSQQLLTYRFIIGSITALPLLIFMNVFIDKKFGKKKDKKI